MTDTIDLLEAIGQDASLRYASAETLTKVLEQAQASGALTAAVASGDSKRLFEEFGHLSNEPPQSIQQVPGHEGDDDDHKHKPGHPDKPHHPHHPPAPDKGEPSPKR